MLLRVSRGEAKEVGIAVVVRGKAERTKKIDIILKTKCMELGKLLHIIGEKEGDIRVALKLSGLCR